MKTNSKLLVVILMTLFTVFSGKNAVAQFGSTYQIHNLSSGCSADGTWQIYKRVGGACIVCTSGTFNLAPGTMTTIPIPTGCQSVCDIVVTLNNVGGVALTPPVTVSQSTSTQPVVSSVLCSPLPTLLTWSPINASINP